MDSTVHIVASCSPFQVKRAERLNMAQEQDPTTAAVLGGAGAALPFGFALPGIYAGAKSDSLGTGASASLRNLLYTLGGAVGGAGLGGLAGLGIGGLTGAGLGASTGEAGAAAAGSLLGLPVAGLGASIGGGLGGILGGAYGSHRGANKYNDKLRAYRKHQKDLAGPVININGGERQAEPQDEDEEKAAAMHQHFLYFPKQAGRFTRIGQRIIGNANRAKRYAAAGGAKARDAAQKTLAQPARAIDPAKGAWRQPRALMDAGRRATAQETVRATSRGAGTGIGAAMGRATTKPGIGLLGKKRFLLPAVGAAAYGRGLGTGVEHGAAQVTNAYESQSPWKSMGYGLAGLFGKREGIADKILAQRQDNRGMLEKLLGINYNEDGIGGKLQDLRDQRG